MSEKNLDRSGRLRSHFIGLRASEEENALITHLAQMAGMTKQDWVLSKAMERTVVIEPSVKVEKALRNRLEALCEELRALDGESLTQELQEELAFALDVCRQLGPSEKAKPEEPIRGFSRGRATSAGCTRKSTADTRTDIHCTADGKEAVQ